MSIQPPSTIQTQRLLLRRPVAADAPAIFEYASDPEVTRYMAWAIHHELRTVEEFIQLAARWWDSGEHHAYLIEKDGTVVGSCGFVLSNFKADLGWVLRRRSWGEGIAPEAAKALADWLWSQPEIQRIGAYCHADNVASTRVMEKLGMQREGLLRKWAIYPNVGPEPQDSLVYGMVR